MFSSKNLRRALFAAVLLGMTCRADDEPRVLTQVAEIRALSRAEAAKGLPVRFRGVVGWASAHQGGSFIVHDGSRGIWVDRSVAGKPNSAVAPASPMRTTVSQ